MVARDPPLRSVSGIRCQCNGDGVDDPLGDIGGPADVAGIEVPCREVSVLRDGSISSDAVGVAEVGGRDHSAELVACVVDDNAVGSLAAANPESGGSKVSGQCLADGVMTSGYRERGVGLAERAR